MRVHRIVLSALLCSSLCGEPLTASLSRTAVLPSLCARISSTLRLRSGANACECQRSSGTKSVRDGSSFLRVTYRRECG